LSGHLRREVGVIVLGQLVFARLRSCEKGAIWNEFVDTQFE
jgi:hypothetical protein